MKSRATIAVVPPNYGQNTELYNIVGCDHDSKMSRALDRWLAAHDEAAAPVQAAPPLCPECGQPAGVQAVAGEPPYCPVMTVEDVNTDLEMKGGKK